MMRSRALCYLGTTCLLGLLLTRTTAEALEGHAALMEKYGLKAGMRITKENARLIKELVPEAFYRRVENGDYAPTIGELSPPDSLTKVFPAEYYRASEQNAGKYDVDSDDGIIDKTTGQRPWPMPYGLPFPGVDVSEDPKKVGAKIQWNAFSLFGSGDEGDTFARVESFGLRGASDRGFLGRLLKQSFDFRQESLPTPVKAPLSFQEIIFFLEPSDVFGNATLTWRWADAKKWDSTWNYSPSTRRVRRLTTANRSDGVLGTELTNDDSNLKTEMFGWKYIGEQAILMPFMVLQSQAEDDYVVKQPVQGKNPASRFPQVAHAFETQTKRITYAYNEDPQRYASWWVPDLLWVVVPGYVVEAFPKDPYYNYGRMIYWYDAATYTQVWKLIYNRSGEYWRTLVLASEFLRFKGTDGKERAAYDLIGAFVSDELTNRGTINVDPADSPTGTGQYHVKTDPEAASLSRFMMYGK